MLALGWVVKYCALISNGSKQAAEELLQEQLQLLQACLQ
jgi:hypothetical protein